MHFTDKEIGVFREVMATESISAAGFRLRLSQPSVSRIIGGWLTHGVGASYGLGHNHRTLTGWLVAIVEAPSLEV